MSFFERYLSVWVGLCMIFGVLIGHFLPAVPTFLSHLEITNVSVPVVLVTIVGVLVEVPIMLGLVRYANKTRDQFS